LLSKAQVTAETGGLSKELRWDGSAGGIKSVGIAIEDVAAAKLVYDRIGG
jgi:ornithine cyclodeaminase/alanine dehydrogenase-like protein (mu-crystallin family)